MGDTDRLDGWKSIADHLGVTVKTAQRYEAERGMPVHALPGGSKRTVYASKQEIEAWRVLEAGDVVRLPAAPARKWLPVLAGGVLVVLGVLSLAAYRWTRSRSAIRVTVNGQDIVGWDVDGRTAWRHRLQQPVHPPDPVWIQKTAVPNAEPGFLVAARLERASAQSILYSLTERGALLWTYRPEMALRFNGREFRAPWVITAVLGAGEGLNTAVASVVHHNWWPSFLTQFDPAGRPRVLFVHAGHIYAVRRQITSSGPRLVAGGVSNEHDGGIVAILPESPETAWMPERSDIQYRCGACGTARPERYYVFPRTELNLAETQPYNRVFEVSPQHHGVLILTEETLECGARYNLSNDLKLESYSFNDSFWDVHRRMEREGKIRHAAADCPERRGREVLEWTPQQGWRTLKIPAEESLPVAR